MLEMNLKSFENYIDEAKTEDKFMLELGSGISTQLFARNFKNVFSYENNLEYMMTLPRFDNVEYINIDDYRDCYFSDIAHFMKDADYIFIDNDPKYIKREIVMYYACKYAKPNCKIILDNGLWNIKAQRYLQKRYFCKDFFGMREEGVFTNTIVGEMKIPDYYKKI
jgi:hypothetical protein